MARFTVLSAFCFILPLYLTLILAFPQYISLAGLSIQAIEEIRPFLHVIDVPPPPPPQTDNSSKLVNDADHPWMPLGPNDIRGPCPGLNTLASHGYLNRSGIVQPADIVMAVQEGYNMGYDIAMFLAYATLLTDGNILTNLISLGKNTSETGTPPSPPAMAAGMNTHNTIEGDASLTRGDAYFGNYYNFNESLFQELIDFSDQFGGGYYNPASAAEYRWQRIRESIATNPNFTFTAPRYEGAYFETVFPYAFFVSGRSPTPEQLDMVTARGFFQWSQMPDGFWRREGSYGFAEIVPEVIENLLANHPFLPGQNIGTINNYTVDPNSANITQPCLLYENFVNNTVPGLYPDPTGDLLDAIKINIGYFYIPFNITYNCTQVFPYGM